MGQTTDRTDETLRRSRAVRGELRRAHFDEGGTVTAWRGSGSVTADRRAKDSRQACRQPHRDED